VSAASRTVCCSKRINAGEGAKVKKPHDKTLFAMKLVISQVAKEEGWRVRYPQPFIDAEG